LLAAEFEVALRPDWALWHAHSVTLSHPRAGEGRVMHLQGLQLHQMAGALNAPLPSQACEKSERLARI